MRHIYILIIIFTTVIFIPGQTLPTISNQLLVSGGALGTPSSGTGTNITGIPAANILSGALANGMTVTTQSPADNSTKAASTAYVDAAAAARGTVTVVGAGSLTSTALVTGGGTTTVQTPATTATMDSSGNISTPGSFAAGVGGSVAGFLQLGQGTAPSLGTTAITQYAPASVTSYKITMPAAAATGFRKWSASGTTVTESVASILSSELPANQVIRSFGAAFDGGGSAIAVNTIRYTRVPYACTITGWSVIGDTGTFTADVFKIASGTTLPSSSITGSVQPALATGSALKSTSLTGWSTSVTADDIVGVKLTAVSGTTAAQVLIECNAS